MRTEPPCRSLGEYVQELVARLGAADASAAARLRETVGDRRARIRLDDESVHVCFRGAELEVRKARRGKVDGEGATDRQTVLDLLDGWIEVKDAILDGRLDVHASPEDVHRIFVAIEIVIDGSARAPALQALARDFRRDPCREARARPRAATRRTPWFPPRAEPDEAEMLTRLDLLPDGGEN
ncbi:MAG: hypothetical protein M3377_08040 [Actinomycetota bacterium]|nr:hypothetical protein [Actinomycetota bacterium]